MNVISRGVRNAFRNYIRTLSLVVIIGLSIGLSLSMLVARQAVNSKIDSVKADVGTSITITPAGLDGFNGGGNPLTETQLAAVAKLKDVTGLNESLEARMTTSDTSLESSINPGTLGRRFAESGGNFGGGAMALGGSTSGTSTTTTFTLPVTAIGTTDPTNLNSSSDEGGGTFKLTSGTVFSDNSTADVAIVGSALATKNSLKVGSTFTAYDKTITVIGIYSAGSTFTDGQVIMPLSTLQTISSQSGDVTSATATANSISNVSTVTSEISKKLGSAADVTNESQEASTTLSPLENIRTITLYSLVGAVVAGAVIILLAMIMIVRERRREIGVLKAIGASNVKVMFQFMSEAVTLTLLGAIIGIIIGVAAGSPITKLLVNNSSSSTTISATTTGGFGGGGFRRFSSGSGTSISLAPGTTHGAFRGLRNGLSDVHAVIGWTIIIYGFLAAIVIAVLGSMAASFFIAKVRPAEVMRVE